MPRRVRVSGRMEEAGERLRMADCLQRAVQDDEIVHENSTGAEMTVI
jgi:hypothetical protein